MEADGEPLRLTREDALRACVCDLTLDLIEERDRAIRVCPPDADDDEYGVWLSRSLVAYEVFENEDATDEVIVTGPTWYLRKQGLLD